LGELARSATRFVLALDSDAAGDQATLRGLHLIRQTVGRRKVPTLSSRGALQHEDRLTIDLRILSLPEGVDPDELIQADKPRWERLVQDAEPLVKYYLNQVVKDLDLSDPRNKSLAVQEMKPILQELNDEIERQYYIQSLARILKIDEAVVEREVLGERASESSGRRRSAGASFGRRSRSGRDRELVDELTPTAISARGYDIEGQCLAYLVAYPTLIHPLSFAFAEAGIPFLDPTDFTRPESQTIFARITLNAEAGALLEKDHLLEALEIPLAEYLADLLARQALAPNTPADEIPDDLTLCALRLKARSLRQRVERLYYLLQEATETDTPEDVAEYARLVQQYSLALQRINRVIHERSMVGRRAHLEPRF
jgi:DNA primase